MHSYVRPNQYVAFRLPSDATKILKVVPDTMIFLGKYGTFPANQIIGRPFYLTFEVFDDASENNGHNLRLITAAELHAETLIADGEGDGDEPDVNGESLPMRTNREIVDDGSAQKLTLEEIEALKKESTGSGREIIAKILESHSALDQKTAFSLAKYTLRKRKKYMKRFTVVPMDVSLLTNYMLQEKDAARIMELRDELIGLLGCWANVHHAGNSPLDGAVASKPRGRYLVVDETGGLVVAAMAERMGILYPHDGEDDREQQGSDDVPSTEGAQGEQQPASRHPRHTHMSAPDNSIFLLHANKQPNMSLLKYFGYDQDNPSETHPLYSHLKPVSWLQLLEPQEDTIYAQEPELLTSDEIAALKSSKRSTYYRKRARWERTQAVVNEARAGGFDGLVVATLMKPISVLRNTVPLLSGSAPVAVYSPVIEPLTEVMDSYSTARKTAYITKRNQLGQRRQEQEKTTGAAGIDSQDPFYPELAEEFYVNPTLLLAPTLETSRVRSWQVLPGRTHPMMSGRGGAEGYIFHASRVLPTQQTIQAAGNPSRKRRRMDTGATTADSSTGADVEMNS
ncbi:hypothetical protein P168DRAFT_308557 [Aspergillus campestris IBT 28561]|uniref:tRNA (adenine(58)-N(1))-methyltransferase non-catalytic subunit TRM6 n=1 Tax=Aspergillus campestris (strain IBT 28561) TaxID=1392248 RepID=A0A2I1DFK9_ASPC2|nr:uncharacterized protein P168DRAFT_308557 [Aspergillus campestris IBT 28561]PKY08641.1 hypothetical protein P168DRAFT_308557 [Aspergillus campestris IBT 28561]